MPKDDARHRASRSNQNVTTADSIFSSFIQPTSHPLNTKQQEPHTVLTNQARTIQSMACFGTCPLLPSACHLVTKLKQPAQHGNTNQRLPASATPNNSLTRMLQYSCASSSCVCKDALEQGSGCKLHKPLLGRARPHPPVIQLKQAAAPVKRCRAARPCEHMGCSWGALCDLVV